MTTRDTDMARRLMIKRYLKPGGIIDSAVLEAFAKIPRHQFLSQRLRDKAYLNLEQSIGYGQKMLSPLILASLLQGLKLTGSETILEVGTGSGYLTALLMYLGRYVFSLEHVVPLAEKASRNLQSLDYHNVDLHIGDGSQGLADMASFDVIITTAYVSKIPAPLAKQLHPLRGRMIIPVGDARQQQLKLVRREANQWHARSLATVMSRHLSDAMVLYLPLLMPE